MRIWKPYVSWSDCRVLTKMMNELHREIVESLSRGKHESGILYDDSSLRIAMIDLQKTIERIRLKDKND